MKNIKFSKIRLMAIFSTAVLLGIPSLQSEAAIFSLTAPSELLLRATQVFMAKKMKPSVEEAKFINLVMNPQTTQTTQNPQKL